MRHQIRVSAFVLLLPLVACNRETSGDSAPRAAPAASPVAVEASPEQAATPAAGAVSKVDSVPVSNAALGEFPYFTLPAGYVQDRVPPVTKDYARFPFRVEGKDHWIEGRFHVADFKAAEGKGFSGFEVQKNFDSMITALGGVKLEEGRIPETIVKGWGSEITEGFKPGVDPAMYMYPKATSTIWRVRRTDGDLWVFLTTNDTRGGYVIGRAQALVPTSQLITAASLKQAIDTAGKAVVHVNFATDRTEILPDSQPQIDEIVRMLQSDTALALAVNGHTDDTGTPAHNQIGRAHV